MRHHCLFKMESIRATLNVFSCLACESLSLLLLLHIVLLLIAVGLKSLPYWVLAGSHCEALLWIIFRTGLGQEHSSPTSPIMKPVPKRLRTYFDCEPILAICRDFCLPGVH
jgi:hypothetical protein